MEVERALVDKHKRVADVLADCFTDVVLPGQKDGVGVPACGDVDGLLVGHAQVLEEMLKYSLGHLFVDVVSVLPGQVSWCLTCLWKLLVMRSESCLSVKVESSSSQSSINMISSPSSFNFLPHFFLAGGGAGVSPKAIARARSSSAWASWMIQSTELVLIS